MVAVSRWWCWTCGLALAVACSGSSTVRTSGADDGRGGANATGGAGGSGGSPGGRGGASGKGGSAGDASGTGGTRPGPAGAGGAGQAGDAGGGGDSGASGGDCDEDGVIEGNVVARGTLEELSCAVEVRGSLEIRLDASSPSSLPLLKVVTDGLRITARGNGGQPSVFTLPALESARWLELEALGDVTGIRMPSLAHVIGTVRVNDNPALASLDADTWPALRRIDGELVVGECTVEGPEEEEVFECAANPVLELVELPSLTTVAGIVLGENPEVLKLVAPALETVGHLELPHCLEVENQKLKLYNEVVCADLGKLADVRLPAIETLDVVWIHRPSSLDRLDFPALTEIGNILVVDESLGAPLVLDLPELTTANELRIEQTDVAWSFPALETASRIDLRYVAAVETPTFPRLTSIDEFVWSNRLAHDFDCGTLFPSLPGDAYPALNVYADLSSFDCPEAVAASSIDYVGSSLTTIEFPGLTTVGAMRFRFTGSLTSLFMPELVTAESLEIRSAPFLENVSMPKLGPNIDSLVFIDNAVLTRPDMPLLVSAGSLSAQSNAAWSECDLASWATSLGTKCGCGGNLPCP